MTQSLKQIAYQHLRRKLLSGAYPPGHRISPDASARELGISQTPVREAIGLLESEGLVEQVPNLGAFVRRPDRREIADLYDVRILLEAFAAARAARRIRPRELSELERTFVRIRELSHKIRDGGDKVLRGALGQELAVADATFHLILLRAAGNARVMKIIDDLQVISRLMSTEPAPIGGDIAAEMGIQVRQHYRIFQAVRGHDPKAARRAMREHLVPTKRITLERFDAMEASPANLPGAWSGSAVQMTIRQREHSAASRATRKRTRPRKSR